MSGAAARTGNLKKKQEKRGNQYTNGRPGEASIKYKIIPRQQEFRMHT